jgi:hypothetical protein
MTSAELIAELRQRGWTDLADEVSRRTGGLSETVRRWLPGLEWSGDAFVQTAKVGPAILAIFDQHPIARLGISIRFEGVTLRAQSCHAHEAPAFVGAILLSRLSDYFTSDRRSTTVQRRVDAAQLAHEALRIALAPDCKEVP